MADEIEKAYQQVSDEWKDYVDKESGAIQVDGDKIRAGATFEGTAGRLGQAILKHEDDITDRDIANDKAKEILHDVGGTFKGVEGNVEQELEGALKHAATSPKVEAKRVVDTVETLAAELLLPATISLLPLPLVFIFLPGAGPLVLLGALTMSAGIGLFFYDRIDFNLGPAAGTSISLTQITGVLLFLAGVGVFMWVLGLAAGIAAPVLAVAVAGIFYVIDSRFAITERIAIHAAMVWALWMVVSGITAFLLYLFGMPIELIAVAVAAAAAADAFTNVIDNKFFSVPFTGLWVASTVSAVLTLLTGNVLSIGFVGMAATSALTTVYMVKDRGQGFSKLKRSIAVLGPAERAAEEMLGTFIFLGFIWLIAFAGLVGQWALGILPASYLNIFNLVLGLLGPFGLYWGARMAHVGDLSVPSVSRPSVSMPSWGGAEGSADDTSVDEAEHTHNDVQGEAGAGHDLHGGGDSSLDALGSRSGESPDETDINENGSGNNREDSKVEWGREDVTDPVLSDLLDELDTWNHDRSDWAIPRFFAVVLERAIVDLSWMYREGDIQTNQFEALSSALEEGVDAIDGAMSNKQVKDLFGALPGKVEPIDDSWLQEEYARWSPAYQKLIDGDRDRAEINYKKRKNYVEKEISEGHRDDLKEPRPVRESKRKIEENLEPAEGSPTEELARLVVAEYLMSAVEEILREEELRKRMRHTVF